MALLKLFLMFDFSIPRNGRMRPSNAPSKGVIACLPRPRSGPGPVGRGIPPYKVRLYELPSTQ